MGFEAGLPASTRRQYRRIWRQENQYYFGVAGQLLAAGLAQPNQAYRYAINYPLARAAALALGNGASRPISGSMSRIDPRLS